MNPARTVLVLSAALLVAGALPVLAEHPYGSCPPTPTEVCERWSAVVDDDTAVAPARSDQFGTTVLVAGEVTVVVASNVALNSEDPYASTATALVRGYSTDGGEQLWSTTYSDRAYVNVRAAALSPDGSTVFVTGGAYDGFPAGGATDAQVMTVAFSTADGTQRWAAHWDARPDGTDNAKAVVVSPDGTEVYVAGITTAGPGDLDYLTVAYSAADGRELWSAVYAGPRAGGSDAVFGLAVNPVHDLLYVTGWSDGVVDFDADYATVAYALGGAPETGPGRGRGKGRGRPSEPQPAPGEQVWVARYDGLGQDRSERANALAVSPDGEAVYVTGDSFSGPGGAAYGYATVAYDARSGAQRWDARFDGGRGGFNSGSQLVATTDRVLVTGQATAADAADGNDATTVAYDPVSGQQLWTASVAAPRSDELTRDLQLSPDGRTAYVLASSTPIVKYTALSRMTLTAYSTDDGARLWTSTLTAGGLDALKGVAVSVAPDGRSLAVLGDHTRSADPLGPPYQDVYDVVVATYDT